MLHAIQHPRDAEDASVLHTRCMHAGSITKMWRDTHLIADAYIGEAPGLRVAHGCPEGPPLGPLIPCDELYGVQRVLHQRLYLCGGHTLLVAQAVVDDPDRLRAQLLIQQHVLVQAQACMQSSFCQGFWNEYDLLGCLELFRTQMGSMHSSSSSSRNSYRPRPVRILCYHSQSSEESINSCSITACNARAVAYAEMSLMERSASHRGLSPPGILPVALREL